MVAEEFGKHFTIYHINLFIGDSAQIVLGGLDIGMRQTQTDVENTTPIERHYRPRVAGHVGGEVEADELGELFEGLVVGAQRAAIDTVALIRVVALPEDGQQVGGVGGIAVENLLGKGMDADSDAPAGLTAAVRDVGAAMDITLAQVEEIDGRHAPEEETEQEEVSGLDELVEMLGEALAGGTFVLRRVTCTQGTLDVEREEPAHLSGSEGTADGLAIAQVAEGLGKGTGGGGAGGGVVGRLEIVEVGADGAGLEGGTGQPVGVGGDRPGSDDGGGRASSFRIPFVEAGETVGYGSEECG